MHRIFVEDSGLSCSLTSSPGPPSIYVVGLTFGDFVLFVVGYGVEGGDLKL